MDPRTTSVAGIMSSNVLTLRSKSTVRQALTALEAHGISGAPVADENGTCVGVFSLSDMARAASFFSEESDRERPEGERFVGSIDQETIGDWMSRDVKSIPSTTSVEAAARQMARAGIHRLLVTDESGIAGLVTSMDIVRWTGGFARAGSPEESLSTGL